MSADKNTRKKTTAFLSKIFLGLGRQSFSTVVIHVTCSLKSQHEPFLQFFVEREMPKHSEFHRAVQVLPLLLALGCVAGCQMPGGKLEQRPKQPCVVLALPDTGPHAEIAKKIRAGGVIAKEELKKNGIDLRLENVNTQASDWTVTLEQLPAQCTIVGGPLQAKAYEQARKAGALERRAFFTFLAHLNNGDEGVRAWRFFPGPQDQLDALLNFAGKELNIRSYGAFYPTDSYGERMTELFGKSLAAHQMTLEKAPYSPASPTSWSAAARPLINPIFPEGSRQPIPGTRFEAIFLPDSWKKVELLLNSLLYNGEDRLVILGTSLWEQGLNGKNVTMPEKYALAVFPGAWDASNAPAGLKGRNSDFWVALGYDFIQFATQMDLFTRPEASEITARARKHQRAIRSLAPLAWSADGQASQALHLFQPAANGFKRLNLEEFQQKRRVRLEKAALRFQNIEEQAAETSQPFEDNSLPTTQHDPTTSNSGPSTVPQTPQQQPSPDEIIDTVPRPSYKLRLPTKR